MTKWTPALDRELAEVTAPGRWVTPTPDPATPDPPGTGTPDPAPAPASAPAHIGSDSSDPAPAAAAPPVYEALREMVDNADPPAPVASYTLGRGTWLHQPAGHDTLTYDST